MTVAILTSDATSMVGPVTADDSAHYRLERQSRGAVHAHSMVWADPSDSVQ